MSKSGKKVSRSVLTSLFVFGAMSAATPPGDHSNPSQATVIHRRPAGMEELSWPPQPPGGYSQTEPSREVAFSLFDGELHRIAADYDQSQTEGWTAGDFVEAISPAYGTGARPAPAKVAPQSYGDPDEPVGVLKRLEAPDRAAILEAARLDEREAPLREADRVTKENDVERARLERAGLVNNPKFRP